MFTSPAYHSLPTISPSRSTPSLEDCIDYPYSPPDSWDDFLASPNINDYREIRRLEDVKLAKEEQAAKSDSLHYLPTLDGLAQGSLERPLGFELPAHSSWEPQTISPADAFYDYDEVRRFLREQARPSSPSQSSIYSSYPPTPCSGTSQLPDDSYSAHTADTQTPLTSSSSPHGGPQSNNVPHIRTGKRSRNECESFSEDKEEPYRAKRSRVEVDEHLKEMDGDGLMDDDNSGDYILHQARASSSSRRNARPLRPPKASAPSKTKPAPQPITKSRPRKASNSTRLVDYKIGPCNCRQCSTCSMTCFYVFSHGDRKGQTCGRFFESARILDKRRHESSHAIQEWIWVENGTIPREQATWYDDEKSHAYMCPYGDCDTLFTRSDAMMRHMYSSCPYKHLRRELEAEIRAENNLPALKTRPSPSPSINDNKGHKEVRKGRYAMGNAKQKDEKDPRSHDEPELRPHLLRISHNKCSRVLRANKGHYSFEKS